MRSTLALAGVLACANAAGLRVPMYEWTTFQTRFGRVYTPEEASGMARERGSGARAPTERARLRCGVSVTLSRCGVIDRAPRTRAHLAHAARVSFRHGSASRAHTTPLRVLSHTQYLNLTRPAGRAAPRNLLRELEEDRRAQQRRTGAHVDEGYVPCRDSYTCPFRDVEHLLLTEFECPLILLPVPTHGAPPRPAVQFILPSRCEPVRGPHG